MSNRSGYSPEFLAVGASKLSAKLRRYVCKRLLPAGVPLPIIDDVIMSKDFALGSAKAELIQAEIKRDYKEPWPMFITLGWTIDVAGKHEVPIIYVEWEFSKFLKEKLAYE